MSSRWVTLFCSLIMLSSEHAYASCCCNGNGCPTYCPDTTVVAAIVAQANALNASDVISASPTVFLQQDEALYLVTTQGNTYFCPIKRFGGSPLCFYRSPVPNTPLGGWSPVTFSTSDELFQAWFSCNTIPELSRQEKRLIASLFLPGVCRR